MVAGVHDAQHLEAVSALRIVGGRGSSVPLAQRAGQAALGRQHHPPESQHAARLTCPRDDDHHDDYSVTLLRADREGFSADFVCRMRRYCTLKRDEMGQLICNDLVGGGECDSNQCSMLKTKNLRDFVFLKIRRIRSKACMNTY